MNIKNNNANISLKSKIGIITYDVPHLKTEQLVHNLLRNGYSHLNIIAFPFKKRINRDVLIQHRPNQIESIGTENLASANRLGFVRFEDKTDLPECDVYLIAGAGILDSKIIEDRKIINAHPGIIPSCRGLDSFKWSIFHGLELGITLHYIDESIDNGRIISMQKTPVYSDDTLLTLARRHYELEIDMLSNFSYHLANALYEKFPINEAHRRMPINIEAKLCARFKEYKKKYALRGLGF